MTSVTITGHHGTRHRTLPKHPGLCIAVGGSDDGYLAASDYAIAATTRDDAYVFEVVVAGGELCIEEIEVDPRACWDSASWPCDTEEEISSAVARGVDAILFHDATATGRQHRTLRLLSARAMAAIVTVERYAPAE
jgi:hypothetical protein